MEDLWIDLYERGYIERNDVQVVQFWLAALEEIDYKFPSLQSSDNNDRSMAWTTT
jgi:hypothetical protein